MTESGGVSKAIIIKRRMESKRSKSESRTQRG